MRRDARRDLAAVRDEQRPDGPARGRSIGSCVHGGTRQSRQTRHASDHRHGVQAAAHSRSSAGRTAWTSRGGGRPRSDSVPRPFRRECRIRDVERLAQACHQCVSRQQTVQSSSLAAQAGASLRDEGARSPPGPRRRRAARDHARRVPLREPWRRPRTSRTMALAARAAVGPGTARRRLPSPPPRRAQPRLRRPRGPGRSAGARTASKRRPPGNKGSGVGLADLGDHERGDDRRQDAEARLGEAEPRASLGDDQVCSRRTGPCRRRAPRPGPLSVQENLDLYADLHGITGDERRVRYPKLMEMTNLGAFVDRLAGRLSGGMKQKLGLACTLVRSPELLLLDEPTVGVDPLSRRELWEIILQLVGDQGLTVLLSTSYLDEAERCGRVVVLHHGKVLARGKPEEVSGLAAGRTFLAETPSGQKTSSFQSRLLGHEAKCPRCGTRRRSRAVES